MTIEELRQKPIGVLETRSFIIKARNRESEEHYFLIKCEGNRYFVGFSDDGSYCSTGVSEEYMVELINDKEASDEEAADIYWQSPHLSCWLTD